MATGKDIKDVYDMMKKIYIETSKLINVINDMFINKGFDPVGDNSVIWGRSNHYRSPESWLPYFLQRVFVKEENSMKGVGINIMFDGSIDGLENNIPFLTCGLLEFPKEKVTKGNALYMAGWVEHNEVQKQSTGNLSITKFTDGINSTTYFLPLEILSSQENVEQYIINPLICMYKGEFAKAENMVQNVAIGLEEIIGKAE
ncbi:hypothetical protein HYI36_14845 [Bacillus sp. Gen3]|nr:hypothetical protein [Bacillus sp. Gen3]